MKKILGLTVAALLVMTLVGGGTWAYFSDVETSSNQLTAGTIDLKINGGDADVAILSTTISNVTPGMSVSVDFQPLQYVGTVTTNNLVVGITTLNDAPGTTTDAESDSALGNDPSDEGELSELLEVTFWLDIGQDGWSAGDEFMVAGGTWTTVNLEANPAAVAVLLNTFAPGTWALLDADWANNETNDFYIYWEFPEGGPTDNKAQGDIVDIDFSFEMRQD